MWGCRPQSSVGKKTKMVKDVIEVLEHRFDPNTLMLHIPSAFDHLKGQDTSFEMVTSNTIQPLCLEYQDNIITESVAVVFINSSCNKVQNMEDDKKIEALVNAQMDQQTKKEQIDPTKVLEEIKELSDSDRKTKIRETFYLPWRNAFERGNAV